MYYLLIIKEDRISIKTCQKIQFIDYNFTTRLIF